MNFSTEGSQEKGNALHGDHPVPSDGWGRSTPHSAPAFRSVSFLTITAILFIFSIASFVHAEDDFKIRTTVDKKEVPVGEHVLVTAEMSWRGEADRDINIVQITPPASKLLELTNTHQSVSSRLTSNGAENIRTFRYVYRAATQGDATISPLVVEYTPSGKPDEKRIRRGEEITIRVVPWLRHFGRTLAVAAGALFVILGSGAAIIVFQKKRRANIKPNTPGVKNNGTFERRALEKLDALKPYRVSGEESRYYVGLEDLIASYGMEKFRVRISEPSEKHIRSLFKGTAASEAFIDLAVRTYRLAEKVKFGGYRPSRDEEDQAIRETERYFSAHLPKADEEDQVETIDQENR